MSENAEAAWSAPFCATRGDQVERQVLQAKNIKELQATQSFGHKQAAAERLRCTMIHQGTEEACEAHLWVGNVLQAIWPAHLERTEENTGIHIINPPPHNSSSNLADLLDYTNPCAFRLFTLYSMNPPPCRKPPCSLTAACQTGQTRPLDCFSGRVSSTPCARPNERNPKRVGDLG